MASISAHANIAAGGITVQLTSDSLTLWDVYHALEADSVARDHFQHVQDRTGMHRADFASLVFTLLVRHFPERVQAFGYAGDPLHDPDGERDDRLDPDW